MENSRLINSIRNITWGFVNKVIMLLFPFIIRTAIIKELGNEYLGLSGLFTSLLQVLSLSELGIGSAMVYSMYEPIANDDKKTLSALLNLYRKLYRFIGCLILVLGLILIPFLPHLINGTYPNDINLTMLYLIFLFNTAISYFLFAYKSSLLIAYQRNDIESNITTITNIIMYIIQIAVLLLFKNYYIYTIFLPASTIALNLFRSFVVDKRYPDIKCEGSVDKSVLTDIKKRIGSLIGHQISGTVNCSFDNIVVSAFLGLNVLAVYGNYYYVVSSLSSVLFICFNSMTASIGNSVVTESKQKNYEDFKQIFFLNMWIVGWCSICMICLYQHFITLWVGEENLLPISSMILFVIYFYSWQSRRTVLTYKNACGMWEADKFKPYVSMAVNLAFNIISVQFIGINGVLISTIIAYLFIEAPWETYVLHKKYFDMSIRPYLSRLIAYTIMIGIAMCGTYMLCTMLSSQGIIWFVVKCAICLVFPNVIVMLFSFKTKEFQSIWIKMKKIISPRYRVAG